MRTALFYDTETTGLPEMKLPSDDPKQPYIFQFAAELVDLDTRHVIAGFDHLIKPAGWIISPEIEALTGVSTERAAMFGLDMAVVLPIFLTMWQMTTVHRVAHNEVFDMRLVRTAIKRDGGFSDALADRWKESQAFCTCRAASPIVNLPPTEKMRARGMTQPKLPNLGEAYEFFTGQKLENAHNAMVDVHACKTIYFALLDREQQAAA